MQRVETLVAAAAIAGLSMVTAGQAAVSPGTGRTGQPPAADATAWKIDPVHSAANFAVRHLMVSTVRGKLGPVTGTVWYDGTNVSSIRADVTIDVKSLNSGDQARDKDLRGPDFFAANRYPTLTFKSKRVAPGSGGHFTLVGDLTMRDVTKEVTLDVEGPAPVLKTEREQRTAATATTTLNRFDYGLKWNTLIETGGAIVGPEVKVTIDLEIIRPNTSGLSIR